METLGKNVADMVVWADGYTYSKGFDSGGQGMDEQLVAPGVTAHNRRHKYWCVHELDLTLGGVAVFV
jgi:hypothetical protein